MVHANQKTYAVISIFSYWMAVVGKVTQTANAETKCEGQGK